MRMPTSQTRPATELRHQLVAVESDRRQQQRQPADNPQSVRNAPCEMMLSNCSDMVGVWRTGSVGENPFGGRLHMNWLYEGLCYRQQSGYRSNLLTRLAGRAVDFRRWARLIAALYESPVIRP